MNQNGFFIVMSKNDLGKSMIAFAIITYIYGAAMYLRGYNDGKQQKQ